VQVPHRAGRPALYLRSLALGYLMIPAVHLLHLLDLASRGALTKLRLQPRIHETFLHLGCSLMCLNYPK
jgi:hypothetical protein